MSSQVSESGYDTVPEALEIVRQPADGVISTTIPRALPGLACIPIDRGPSFFPLMTLALIGICSVVMGAVVLLARHRSWSDTQQALAEWDEACLLGRESPVDFQRWVTGTPAYRGSAPGPGQYLAISELKTFGEVTLAEALVTLGKPDSSCLDYGLLPGRKAVIWLEALLDGGQIEAYAVLPPGAERVELDTPLHTLRCYTPGEAYHLRGTGPWRGFSPIAAYRYCRTSSTLTPP
jgi:hypothetical protein